MVLPLQCPALIPLFFPEFKTMALPIGIHHENPLQDDFLLAM
jgi:hypothetical protein